MARHGGARGPSGGWPESNAAETRAATAENRIRHRDDIAVVFTQFARSTRHRRYEGETHRVFTRRRRQPEPKPTLLGEDG